ncbi:BTG3 associated nuclear protein [Phyllostomus discolor]|uniref:BTG3 associated nuclear protein n=1 Tax=Phyllostomus discolor TaxID=89673 RepID=A0A833YBY8_9CHIR|nr:BTG3 associated nuclear protein [Phyllostomus discolor]
MMSEQDLADVVQIAVEDLSPHHPVVLENHVVTDEDEPSLKRQRLEINCQDPSIKVKILVYFISDILVS